LEIVTIAVVVVVVVPIYHLFIRYVSDFSKKILQNLISCALMVTFKRTGEL